MKRPELLAPAGDYSCFQAALKAGADAVYLGGNAFGARAYANNFTEEENKLIFETKKIFNKIERNVKERRESSAVLFLSLHSMAPATGIEPITNP